MVSTKRYAIFENFQFDKIVARLIKNKLLYEMIDAICKIDMHMTKLTIMVWVMYLRELIVSQTNQMKLQESIYTRDVVAIDEQSLMFSTEKDELSQTGIIRTIFDPACGTGGMVNL
jgi:type I restriction enzyme M protein